MSKTTDKMIELVEFELDDVTAVLTNKLARFKQPKRLLRVDELPRNAMGKVQKNTLRELCEDRFSWDTQSSEGVV